MWVCTIPLEQYERTGFLCFLAILNRDILTWSARPCWNSKRRDRDKQKVVMPTVFTRRVRSFSLAACWEGEVIKAPWSGSRGRQVQHDVFTQSPQIQSRTGRAVCVDTVSVLPPNRQIHGDSHPARMPDRTGCIESMPESITRQASWVLVGKGPVARVSSHRTQPVFERCVLLDDKH